jgi:antitoxin (DNA-binding transcriptional repressor) of toxin-antitoxin stability system
MRQFNIHEAKHNSQAGGKRRRGEEIVIAKAGKPIARLVPLAAPVGSRQKGALKRKIRVGADFDAPLPDDVLATFEGRDRE